MSAERDGVGLRRVQVELADGFNFSGVVRREYRDSHGRRRIVVEDTQGEGRDVGLWRPSVSITELDSRRWSRSPTVGRADRRGTVGGCDESGGQATGSGDDGQAAVSDGSGSLQEQLAEAYRDRQGGGSA